MQFAGNLRRRALKPLYGLWQKDGKVGRNRMHPGGLHHQPIFLCLIMRLAKMEKSIGTRAQPTDFIIGKAFHF